MCFSLYSGVVWTTLVSVMHFETETLYCGVILNAASQSFYQSKRIEYVAVLPLNARQAMACEVRGRQLPTVT